MFWHRKSPEVEAAYDRVKNLHPEIRRIQNELALQIYGRPANLSPAKVVSSGWQHFLRGDVAITSAGPTSTIAIDSCLLEGDSELTLDQRVLVQLAGAEGTRTANYLATHYGYSGGLWDYEFTAVGAVGTVIGEQSLRALGQPTSPRPDGINWKLLEGAGLKRALAHPHSLGKALCSA
jgi:hypothetical protein